ncbi:MAG: hypothetical protein ACW99G_15275 [Candidatus Thorarchaeota archaeon]|jgi:hypothetical protein
MARKRIQIKLSAPFSAKDLQVVAFVLESLANDLDNNESHVKAGYVGESFIDKRGISVQRVLRAVASVLYKMAGVHKKK